MLDVLSPDEAHRFAADQRCEALRLRQIAQHCLERAAAFQSRADIADINADAWDNAARGIWPEQAA